MTRSAAPAARALASYAVVAVLLVLGLAPLLAGRPALAATTRTIELTASGPRPADLTAGVGDAIWFKNTDPTFVHSVGSASPNWSFQCRPLAPGEICKVGTLPKPGTYLYKGINLDSFSGRVVVPGAATSPAPLSSPKASAAPSPASSPAPQSSPAAPPASPVSSPATPGGTGSVGAPPIAGGFGSVGAPSAAPQPGAPAPNVAPPVLPGEPLPSAQPSGPVVVAAPGRLPESSTARRYGLPAALAGVAAVGVASLLVRLLLAHPAARQARHARSGPAVTVD